MRRFKELSVLTLAVAALLLPLLSGAAYAAYPMCVSSTCVSGASGMLRGQDEVVIPDAISCPDCSIVLELVASLGGTAEQDGLICGDSGTVAVDSKGRFYVAPTCTPGTVDLYDSSGSFVETLGRLGQGPGEFAYVVGVAVDGDDFVHVFDTDRRHTILNQDHEYVETRRTPTQPWQVLFGRNGTMVQQLTIASPERVGLPLHALDSTGAITASFGAIDRTYRADQGWRQLRAIAWAGEDAVWSVPFAPYEIERWTTGGELEARIRRQSEWFPPRDRERGPTVRSIREDAQGRLWVVIVIVSPDWDGSPPKGPAGMSEMLDTVIEVVDPGAGRVLASTTVDEVFSWWAGGMLYNYREEDNGDLHIDVWNMRLNDRNRGVDKQ